MTRLCVLCLPIRVINIDTFCAFHIKLEVFIFATFCLDCHLKSTGNILYLEQVMLPRVRIITMTPRHSKDNSIFNTIHILSYVYV